MSAGPSSERRLRGIGLAVTVAIHLGVGLAAWGASVLDGARAEQQAKSSEELVHIEAGLAIRSSSAAGKRSRLPQKDLGPQKGAPETPGVAMDPSALPHDKRDAGVTDEIDPEATFNKFRRPHEESGTAAGSEGEGDMDRAGAVNGSEFGTLEDVKGDPYVGELVGRMTTNPEISVPSIVTDSGLSVLGCVKLDARGKLVERAVPDEHKSADRTFNRAVEERLRITTDMEGPVPERLRDRLVEKWLCVPYTY